MEADRSAYFTARQSRSKLGLGLAVCAVGLAAGVAILIFDHSSRDPILIGLLFTLGFALPTLLYLRQWLRPCWVALSPAGVEAQLVLRRVSWQWSEIKEVSLRLNRSIVFILVHTDDGRTHRLPANWDQRPQQIAEQIHQGINRFRSGGAADA